MCSCQRGQHVLYESTAWVEVVQLEVNLMLLLKQGLLHTLLKAAESGGWGGWVGVCGGGGRGVGGGGQVGIRMEARAGGR